MTTGFAIGRCVPPAPVDAPTPGVPSQFGLFSAARIIESPPRHELNGIEYEPVCNVSVDEWPLECFPYRRPEPLPEDGNCGRVVEPMPHVGPDEGPSEPYLRKLFSHSTGVTKAVPFGLYAGEDCFLGNHDQTQALADLRDRFTLGEQTACERVIYDGLMGVYPALRYKPQILTAEGRDSELVSLFDGIGLLEHWLACSSGATGVIHAPRYLAAGLSAGQEIRHVGQRAISSLGHTLVFGAGYSGAAPFGDEGPVEEKPDKLWLYASRPVTIRRSELLQPANYSGRTGAFDMQRNEASLLYERIYVVDWPCEVAAVQVDYPRFKLSTKTTEEGQGQ